MTEGGYGDQYRDGYGEQPRAFPPAPAAPWADPAAQQQAAPTGYGPPPGPQQQDPQQAYAPVPGSEQQDPQQAYGPPPGFHQQDPQQAYAQPYSQPYAQQAYAQPYGQQPYGQQPFGQQPFGQQAFGQPPWGPGPPGYGAPPVTYASWWSRAGAVLLDVLFSVIMYLPGLILLITALATADTETSSVDGSTTITDINGGLVAVGTVLCFLAFCWQVWNIGWRQGAQGWSWGKQVIGIKLVKESTAQPPGGWIGIARMVLRYVLGQVTFGVYTVLTCLWPLWDEKKQTLDDKMLSTLVVRAR